MIRYGLWRASAPSAMRSSRPTTMRLIVYVMQPYDRTMKIDAAKVLVTGGSSGIGFETARQLRQRGAQVAICGRDGAKVRAAGKEIGALAIEADVSVEADVTRMVRTVAETFNGYDVLINNAGFGHFSPLVETSLADMQRVLATNVAGAMLAGRESARVFIKQN